MIATSTTARSEEVATRSLRLVLRDHRVLEADLRIDACEMLVGDAGATERFIELSRIRWLDTGEAAPHLILRLDRILWATACDGADLVSLPPAAEPCPVEIGLAKGLTILADLHLASRERLTESLGDSSAFISLRRARLSPSDRRLGDLLLNRDEIHTLRALPPSQAGSEPPPTGAPLSSPEPPDPTPDPDPGATAGAPAATASAPRPAGVPAVFRKPTRSAPRTDGLSAAARWRRERLSTRIDALEAARHALHGNAPEAMGWIRRIAYSLRRTGPVRDLPEVGAAALALEKATGGQVLDALDHLLTVLRDAIDRGGAEPAVLLLVTADPEASRPLETGLAATDREILTARNGAQAEWIVARREVSLILLDLDLPDRDGLDLLGRLRALHDTATVPIIPFSARADGTIKAECFAHGADGYLAKPLAPELVAAAVETELGHVVGRDRVSRRDPETGLPDRLAFRDAFEQAATLARRSGEPLSVALLEITEPGSAAGNGLPLLADDDVGRIAATIANGLRPSDLIARWEGRVFAALFPNTDHRGARLALAKAADAFRPAAENGSGPAAATVSAGVAELAGGESLQEALALAGEFLYLARIEGADRIVGTGDVGTRLPRNRILLAESDDIVASVIRHRLERHGFEVLHCADGVAALATARQRYVSLVVLDLKLPKLGGLELLERLREIPAYGDLPVILLASAVNERDVVRGFELGADDYITKPVSSAELVARVRRLMARVD